MREPRTEVHLVFKFLENVVMVEVRVCEQPVETTDDIVEVFLGVLGNGDSIEVVRVDHCSCVVESVDHVVDSAAS